MMCLYGSFGIRLHSSIGISAMFIFSQQSLVAQSSINALSFVCTLRSNSAHTSKKSASLPLSYSNIYFISPSFVPQSLSNSTSRTSPSILTMPLPTPHLIPIPPPALSPQTIHSTVRKILGLIPIYPTRFHDIEAAKTYISSICASKHILLPEHDKDKITFLVAVRAFEVGEFYLTTPLPDRQALRGACASMPPFVVADY
jgi:hypothetical protein